MYIGFDLMPLSQALDDNEIDVHAIAIATTYPPPDDVDHDYTDGEELGNGPTRRFLQQASEAAMHFKSESRRKMEENGTQRRLVEDSEIIPGRGWEVSISNIADSLFCRDILCLNHCCRFMDGIQ